MNERVRIVDVETGERGRIIGFTAGTVVCLMDDRSIRRYRVTDIREDEPPEPIRFGPQR